MARLPRLSLPGVVHYVLQRGHNGGAIVHDMQDLERLLQVLRETALFSGVVLHAYAVTRGELRVLATPGSSVAISQMMQSLGRRYAALFNRRHGRSGALWDGRFRSALIEPGAPTLLALRHIDGQASGDPGSAVAAQTTAAGVAEGDAAARPESPARSSHAHRTGGRRDGALIDPPSYWQLGNTPFDRESRYRALLAEPLPDDEQAALQRAVIRAWAFGSAHFLEGLADTTQRPVAPRPRGRPRRSET